MADTVRKVTHYSTSVPDKPGQAFRVLATLVSAGINLLGCSGTTKAGRAHIDVIPDDARRFSAVTKKAGLVFSRKKVGFLVQGDDRPGALANTLEHLAKREINVMAVEGLSAGAGRWGAIVWVEEGDLLRAGRVLRTALK